MTAYIIKSSISLLLLFGLYWFLLRKEKLFVFNRFFLIFSVVFSLIIPFISIPVNLPDNKAKDTLVTAINSTVPVFSQEQDLINYADYQSISTTEYEPNAFYERINFPLLLLFLYLTGVILLLIRFLRNIFFITRQIKLSERIAYSGHRLVLTDNQVNPFCFLNTIFVSKQAYLKNEIAGELLNHELEHIRQAHSLDVIFIELIQIIYWFNPVIVLYNRAVRVNHEYLADSGAIQDSADISIYADKLISFVTCKRNVPLSSGFNPSLTRKRLIMLTKSRSGIINYGARIFSTITLAAALFLILSFTPTNSQQTDAGLDFGQLPEPQTLKVKDIDRNEYKTVKIGSNIWMAENLKTTRYNDGTDIPLVRDNNDWQKYQAGYSWYNNEEAENKNTYGALYNWYAVNTNKLCPTGWHVPTHAEYSFLLDPSFRDSIGGNLKETGSVHWNLPNTGATDQTGFTALPGGYRGLSGNFYSKGEQGIWWTSTSDNDFVGVSWYLRNDDSRFSPHWTSKRGGFSVRCIMDYTYDSGNKRQMPLDDTLDKALKIVDGVEYFGKIADIPEQEIQTMSILKDKSATAVFGERGENGVVVITTKKSGGEEQVTVPQGLVSEYQDILNRHKRILQDGKEQYSLNLNDQEKFRLEQIFFQMTKEQQSQQMFVFVPDSSMVLKRSVPTKDQMKAFLDPKMYGVWINNDRVKNEELNKYSNSDFAHFFSSKLERNATNYGKHVYQVDLMTNEYYQKYLTKKLSETGNTLVVNNKRFEKKFNLKDLPDPVAVFHGKSNGSISRKAASETYILEAVLKDPQPDIKFEIVSFKMGMRIDSTDVEVSSDGNKFTDEMRSMLAGLTRGKYIFIKDIKAIGPDNKVRDLNPIVLKID